MKFAVLPYKILLACRDGAGEGANVNLCFLACGVAYSAYLRENDRMFFPRRSGMNGKRHEKDRIMALRHFAAFCGLRRRGRAEGPRPSAAGGGGFRGRRVQRGEDADRQHPGVVSQSFRGAEGRHCADAAGGAGGTAGEPRVFRQLAAGEAG